MSQADAISEAAKAVAENEAHTNVEVEAIEAAATPLTDAEVEESVSGAESETDAEDAEAEAAA